MIGGLTVRKKNFKGRCEKRQLNRCEDICRTFDNIQYAYADYLSGNDDIQSFKVNVLPEGLEEGDYTSDFVITRSDGELMVRECVNRNHLTKPLTAKLLDAGRRFWLGHGVSDWGIVVQKEGADK